MNWKTIKRKWETEFACLPWKSLLILAGICLLCGIIITFSGANRHPIHYYIPVGYPPLFVILFFWYAEYFLLGLGLGIFLFRQKCRKNNRFQEHFCLFLSAMILSYAWIPLVIRGGNLFFALMICLAVSGILLFLLFALRPYTFGVPIILAVCTFWQLYALLYTLFLLLFNR
jgi:tryptophan-rich sensory protein